MDYQTIKKIAKEQGKSAYDLIVLAPQNDPFYKGAPAEIKRAEWFKKLWDDYGFTKGIHKRRIYYRLIMSAEPVYRHDGKQFINSQRDWYYLTQSGKYAKYLGLVDIDAFEDHRNPDPIVYVHNSDKPNIELTDTYYRFDIKLPSMPDFPSYELEDFVSDQKYQLELWCEKSTLNDVLLPICQNIGINLVTADGEFSTTQVREFIRRVEEIGRPARIFYLSDFDPAGQCMPVAVARKIEWMIHHYKLECDVKLFHLALTLEQCIKKELPEAPMKVTQAKEQRNEKRGWDTRTANWEKQYGRGATEIDALVEREGALEKIVMDAVEPYFDRDLDDRVSAVEDELEDDLENIQLGIRNRHTENIAKIEQLIKDINEAAQDKAEKLKELVNDTFDAMETDFEDEKPDLDDYPLPEPDPLGDQMEPLFDSNRSYMDQLDYYKQFQKKGDQ
jgi:hypothetical protein